MTMTVALKTPIWKSLTSCCVSPFWWTFFSIIISISSISLGVKGFNFSTFSFGCKAWWTAVRTNLSMRSFSFSSQCSFRAACSTMSLTKDLAFKWKKKREVITVQYTVQYKEHSSWCHDGLKFDSICCCCCCCCWLWLWLWLWWWLLAESYCVATAGLIWELNFPLYQFTSIYDYVQVFMFLYTISRARSRPRKLVCSRAYLNVSSTHVSVHVRICVSVSE